VRAEMFNPFDEKVIVIDSPDIGAVEQLIRQWVALGSGRGCPAVELTGPDGASLTLGTDGQRGVLVWVNSLGNSSHTISESAGATLVYDYFGSWPEVPAQSTVSLPDALAAARRFLEVGVPESETLLFELD
jgi:hypothetical protein